MASALFGAASLFLLVRRRLVTVRLTGERAATGNPAQPSGGSGTRQR
jgi:hypothetical protein